jgi:hypothetical protein
VQDIVAAPQFTDFTLQFFQPLTFGGGEPAIATTGIALLPAYPGSERLGRTTNLLGNGTDSCSLRAVFMLAFKNQAGGTLTHLGGKLIIFCHPVTSLSGSLVSRVPGAVQYQRTAHRVMSR